jgi:hypothetical protein
MKEEVLIKLIKTILDKKNKEKNLNLNNNDNIIINNSNNNFNFNDEWYIKRLKEISM